MARSPVDRLPDSARLLAVRAARRVRRGRPVAGIVVLLDGDAGTCRRTLDAALAPTERPVDVVLVPLTEPLVAEARERARVDARVKVVEAVGAARTTGRRRAVAALRTRSVLVLVPGAVLLPGALDRLLAHQAATGAEVVLGGYDGPSGATDLAHEPAAARLPVLARMLVDRRRLAALESTVDDADGTVTALGLLREGFVALAGATVDVEPPGTQGTDRTSPWTRLDGLLAALGPTDGLLADLPAAAAERLRGLLSREVTALAEAVEDTDDAGWRRLVEVLDARVDDAVLRDLPVEQRLLVRLARAGVRADLLRFVVARRFADRDLPTEARGGVVRAVLPALPEHLPPHLLELHHDELALRTRLVRARIVHEDLELMVQAGVRHVDAADPALVEARVDLLHGERRIPTDVTVVRDAEVTRWLGDRGQDHDAGSLVVRVPVTDLEGRAWRVHVTLEVAGVRRGDPVTAIDPRGSATRASVADGQVEVDPRHWTPSPGSAQVRDGELLVRLGDDRGGTAELVGDGAVLPGIPHEGGWRFPLVAPARGHAHWPAPTGRYRLLLDGGPVAADALLDALPLEVVTDRHRVLVRRGDSADGGVEVRLAPALGDDELGPRAQTRLQAAYSVGEAPLDPRLVYLQAFTGLSPTDHPVAIHQELVRRLRARPDLADVRVRWMVADSSCPAPPGAEPVLHRSREWYDVLARAGHVVTNVDLERWFRRRPDQEVLQTYHGYPSKRMGIGQWRGRGFPPSRVAQALARSSGTWTALLTPQPDADRWYRQQYAYDGTILALGYPRDDVLVGPDRARRRTEARAALGAGDRKVLLYAPTWRDDLAVHARSAAAVHLLDLAELSERLGEEWLVLLRGHRFHAPATGLGGAGLLDVTAHPEVNDLILAADAAVLDYSSLRFDFALTGRPAVYLVPDLDRYVGEVRGFLQPYPETAPGPLVDDTAGVADALADLDALTARWATPIADFNARFNTLADGHAAARVVDAFFTRLLR